jgi:hypothetical protein
MNERITLKEAFEKIDSGEYGDIEELAEDFRIFDKDGDELGRRCYNCESLRTCGLIN